MPSSSVSLVFGVVSNGSPSENFSLYLSPKSPGIGVGSGVGASVGSGVGSGVATTGVSDAPGAGVTCSVGSGVGVSVGSGVGISVGSAVGAGGIVGSATFRFSLRQLSQSNVYTLTAIANVPAIRTSAISSMIKCFLLKRYCLNPSVTSSKRYSSAVRRISAGMI